MASLLATALLALAEIPTLPKPGIPAEIVATPEWRFRIAVFELMKRVQADPDFASIETGDDQAVVYFKGDANAKLVKYTHDPRIKAVSVPLSATELGEISRSFMLWANQRGLEWEVAGADPRSGVVTIGTRKPAPMMIAIAEDGIDLTHIRIYDSTPHYAPERG